MGVATKLIQRRKHRASPWHGRLTTAVLSVVLVAVFAVVLSQSSVVSRIASQDASPVAAPAGPSASVPAAEVRLPVAVEPAPAIVEPIALVRRAPLAARYPGSLLDAPIGASAAYQRAAAIINLTADCHLDWLTLAAIARIESNHGLGEGGTHRLDQNGLVTPSFVGQPLDGKGGRGTVDDTDAGKVDLDPRWDAPVGPFGLMPATWAAVAVDADSDDVRNPQDVDDASLAASVVLCAGGRDLADEKTLRAALTIYHHTTGFAETVLQLTSVYADEMATVSVFLPLPGTLPIPEDLAEICDCARLASGASLQEEATSQAASGDPASGEEATPPSVDPGTPDADGTVDPTDSGGTTDSTDSGGSSEPVDPPPADSVDPPPSTEPEPEPAPVDPPAEMAPAPEPERLAVEEPEPEPAPAPPPPAEPSPEPAPEETTA